MSDKKQAAHIFGPVNSRRLGFSLGLDIIPYKTCSLDCVYCECGRTTHLTVKRKPYINTRDFLNELSVFLETVKKEPSAKKIDYLTFSGSGEPTLNSELGIMIKWIKKNTRLPVVVITNGTLLYQSDVRHDLLWADVVIPSMDAVSENVFLKINRPHAGLSAKRIIDGIIDFRKEYKGKIWLEILFVRGYNDSENEIRLLSEAAVRIFPDRIQLNTCVRPGTENRIEPLSRGELEKIAGRFRNHVEIVAGRNMVSVPVDFGLTENEIISMLERRPCTIRDLALINNSAARSVKSIIDKIKTKHPGFKSEIVNGEEYYFIEH